MITKFKKPFKELFSKENSSYRVINKSVRLGESLFTIDRITMYNPLFDMLYEKEVGGECLNDVLTITCYFEEGKIMIL